ncbi:hypothetical protein [Phaeodactylibacter luteus]|uniref:Zf-HC2 domain-containing protein n=1 Tax=Phaeodactylibacter luteus TaxID=1564516 RepID=A0A5C6S6Z0_9BACT|nr:hypothetical protein [Phaeodactylibacter luteus]TXB70260.1 hypothetical protein FRY97_00725 [Phaeodactylibacter luteus]
MLSIFLLISVFIVWQGVRQVMKVYACPPDEVITAFWRGKLRGGSPEHRQLITHLGNCEACQEKLHRLRAGSRIEDHLLDEDSRAD